MSKEDEVKALLDAADFLKEEGYEQLPTVLRNEAKHWMGIHQQLRLALTPLRKIIKARDRTDIANEDHHTALMEEVDKAKVVMKKITTIRRGK